MARFQKAVETENIEEVKVEPEVAVEVTVPEVKVPEVKVGNTPILQVSDVKTVKVRPNFSGNKYVGDTWYHFVKGEITTVPKNVRDILVEQKAIEAI